MSLEHEESLPQEQEESEENVLLKEPVLKGEVSSVSGEELVVGERQIVITTSCLSPSEQVIINNPHCMTEIQYYENTYTNY